MQIMNLQFQQKKKKIMNLCSIYFFCCEMQKLKSLIRFKPYKMVDTNERMLRKIQQQYIFVGDSTTDTKVNLKLFSALLILILLSRINWRATYSTVQLRFFHTTTRYGERASETMKLEQRRIKAKKIKKPSSPVTHAR